jgi:Flp pilus assembly protein TadG
MSALAKLRRLLGDQDGVAVLELALAAPILMLMVVGVADMSNAYSRKLALEQAAQRSIEKIMQTTAETTPDSTLQSEAIKQAGQGLTSGNITVEYTLYCNQAKQANYDDECAAGEREARYVSVTVSDEYQPMFPLHFAPINANGKYPVSATAGMRIQ